jgi:RND family efflux transporter MFP subunit
MLTALMASNAWGQLPGVSIQADKRQTLGLQTQTVSPIKTYRSLGYYGHLMTPSTHQWQVATPLAGRVVHVHQLHGPVKAGEPIVTLESAQWLDLQKQYVNLLADAEPLNAAYERARRLSKTGAVSDKQYQEARAALNKNRQQRQQLSQTLKLAGMTEAALQQLRQTQRIEDSKMTLRAPVDGLLEPLHIHSGQRLPAQAAISRIRQAQTLALELSLPKTKAQALSLNQPVEIEGTNQPGLVNYIASELDPLTQTVTVHVRHPNADNQLMAGEMVQAHLLWQAPFNTPAPVYRAPSRALSQFDHQTVIYQLDQDRLQPIRVEVLSYEGDQVIFTLADPSVVTRTFTLISGGTSTVKSLLQTVAESSTEQGGQE